MILFFIIHKSVLTLSTTVFINLSTLSTREVFGNPKHNPHTPNVTIESSQMFKLLLTSLLLNTLITGSIILES